jgi:hypothetical protein
MRSLESSTGRFFIERSHPNTLKRDNEQGFNADAIERRLAHAPRDAVRAAYNRSDYLPERRRMMVAWANYLDEAERGAKIIALRAGGADA